jgi:hypothetical protein
MDLPEPATPLKIEYTRDIITVGSVDPFIDLVDDIVTSVASTLSRDQNEHPQHKACH